MFIKPSADVFHSVRLKTKDLVRVHVQRLMVVPCVFIAGWAHVVCALYIPEVEFANVSTMEPIVLQSVPHERYNKVTESTHPVTNPMLVWPQRSAWF